MKHELITYKDIREKALRNGLIDNKVEIGIWARHNGYIKVRKQQNKKVHYYYLKLS